MWATHLRIQENDKHALLDLAEKKKFIAIFAQAKAYASPRIKSDEVRQWGQHGKEHGMVTQAYIRSTRFCPKGPLQVKSCD